eukprot:COSAG02_NODE_2543_length_8570_cov_24.762956_1_plen_55_part_00
MSSRAEEVLPQPSAGAPEERWGGVAVQGSPSYSTRIQPDGKHACALSLTFHPKC